MKYIRLFLFFKYTVQYFIFFLLIFSLTLLNSISLFRLVFSLCISQYVKLHEKGTTFDFLFVIPEVLLACQICNKSYHVHTRWPIRDFVKRKKREGERRRRRKEWQLEKKKKREASGNASNSDDVNAHQSVIRHRPSLRFVYFLRKALVQHVAATACEWHVCIQRCASSSLLRPSLRSFIHGGWSLATRVCT